jgi:hypothetical protein
MVRMQVKIKTNLQHTHTHQSHTYTLQKDYANVRMQVNTNLQKTAISQSMRTHVACPVPWFPPGALFSMRHAHTRLSSPILLFIYLLLYDALSC